jgi:hypothetical protein
MGRDGQSGVAESRCDARELVVADRWHVSTPSRRIVRVGVNGP